MRRLVVVLAACSHPHETSPVDAPPSVDAPADGSAAAAVTCTAHDPYVAAPDAPHGLYAFGIAPSGPPAWALSSPDVCGGETFVDWSAVDKTGDGTYDWASVESAIAPWAAVGKRTNLLVEAVGFAKTNTTTPAYVLAQVPTVSCTQTANVPVFWNATYESLYKTFIAAVLAKYGSDPRIGYIRFGMSNGAQSGTTVCYNELVTAGLTIPVWEGYIETMATYEASLPHTVQTMLALGPFGTMRDPTFPDWEAQLAVSLGLGIGNQGLHEGDITDFTASPPVACAGGDWCANFSNPAYIGKVPFYLQQVATSCPGGGCSTGPLTDILPFGLSLHAQIFEVYLDDLGVAYDPTNASYAQYGAAYGALFDSLAAKLGRAM